MIPKEKIKIRLGRLFKFEAAHQLPDAKIYGKCSNLHGHSYSLEVEISGYINKKGWVCDFSEIKNIVHKVIIDRYDHHNLNDFIKLPTAENILYQIYSDLKKTLHKKEFKLSRLRLWENEKSYAEIEC